MKKSNIESWKKFKDAGLLWWINMILHTFGWSIVMEYEEGELKNVYPSRVEYRGFSESDNTEGYEKVEGFMKNNLNKE
jgi:hypothetical protein